MSMDAQFFSSCAVIAYVCLYPLLLKLPTNQRNIKVMFTLLLKESL